VCGYITDSGKSICTAKGMLYNKQDGIYSVFKIMGKGVVITILFSILILTAGGLINSALAAHPGEHAPETIPAGPQSGGVLKDTIVSLIDWLFVTLLLTATIFIILAGFQFVTSGGSPEAVSEARRKILYSIIAVLVALFAKAIPVVITNIVG